MKREGYLRQSEETFLRMEKSFLPDGSILQNRYKIEALISGTGMGQVYKAADLRFPGKWWAVKVYPKLPSERFFQEMKSLSALNHPHLAKVVDFFEEEERSCMVMEHVNGQSLEEILDNATSPVPERQALSWGIQTSDALIYLHGRMKEVTHYRNLSPKKILISTLGEVKIVPKSLDLLSEVAQPGLMGYSPPEVFDENAAPDERADVYTLAAVLHRCLVGQSPGSIPFVFVDVHMANPRIVSHIDLVIEKATQANRGKRYFSLGEFRKELYRCLKKVLKSQPYSFRNMKNAPNVWWVIVAASGISTVLWLYLFF